MQIPTNTPMRRVPQDYVTPESVRWFTLPEGPNAGATLFYYDLQVGSGDPEGTVLMVHGNPECSYTWRHVRDGLAASGRSLRIIAPDHLGFGLSDQARFEMVDMHHADHLRQLVAHLDLQGLTLLVHDWGGPIGIGALIDTPTRVRNLVVANSTVFPMPPDGYTYRNFPYRVLPWSKTASWVPAAWWGAVAAYVVSHAHPQPLHRFVAGFGRMLAQALDGSLTHDMNRPEAVWCAQFGSRINQLASQRHVRQTPVWGHGYRYSVPGLGVQDNHAFYTNIQSRIGPVGGPAGQAIGAAGHFGGWDPCGKDSVIAQWQTALPQMQMRRYPDAGHFVEEVKGAEIAADILTLITAHAA